MSLRHRQDAERHLRLQAEPLPHLTIEQRERVIRAREREMVRWLAEKPWLAGRDLAGTIATCRRRHSESIARSRASGDL